MGQTKTKYILIGSLTTNITEGAILFGQKGTDVYFCLWCGCAVADKKIHDKSNCRSR